MEVSKEAHVKFQAKRIGNVYMLRNLKVIIDRLQLSLASKATVMKQSEITMVLSSGVQLYPEERLRLSACNKEVQIVTPMMEQILINHVWIKEIIRL